jgi:hypothetical protein
VQLADHIDDPITIAVGQHYASVGLDPIVGKNIINKVVTLVNSAMEP